MLKCQSVGESGKDAQAHPKHIPNPPCRTCNQRGCSGRCWGFWAGKNRPWKRRQADHELGCKEVGNKGSGLKTLSFQKDVRTDLKEESRRVANPPKRTKGTLWFHYHLMPLYGGTEPPPELSHICKSAKCMKSNMWSTDALPIFRRSPSGRMKRALGTDLTYQHE